MEKQIRNGSVKENRKKKIKTNQAINSEKKKRINRFGKEEEKKRSKTDSG